MLGMTDYPWAEIALIIITQHQQNVSLPEILFISVLWLNWSKTSGTSVLVSTKPCAMNSSSYPQERLMKRGATGVLLLNALGLL